MVQPEKTEKTAYLIHPTGTVCYRLSGTPDKKEFAKPFKCQAPFRKVCVSSDFVTRFLTIGLT